MSRASQPDESASAAFEQNEEQFEQAAPEGAPANRKQAVALKVQAMSDAFVAGNLTGRTIAGYVVGRQAEQQGDGDCLPGSVRRSQGDWRR